MSLSLAIIGYKRPEYLQQVLDSIAACDGFNKISDIVVSIDDGPCRGPISGEVAERWLDGISIPNVLIKQPFRRGIVGNSVLAIKESFDRGAKNVLYVEDDGLLSPDALAVAEWLSIQDHDKYLAYGLGEGSGDVVHPPSAMGEKNHLPCPYAWLCPLPNWEFILRNWCCKEFHPCGWSWSMTHAARLANRSRFLAPMLSRVKNIGRDNGTNGDYRHWEAVLRDVPVSDGAYRGNYEVVRPVTDAEVCEVSDWMRWEIDKNQGQKFDGWLGFGRPQELGVRP